MSASASWLALRPAKRMLVCRLAQERATHIGKIGNGSLRKARAELLSACIAFIALFASSPPEHLSLHAHVQPLVSARAADTTQELLICDESTDG